MHYFIILLIGLFAAFFYRAAEFENESSLLWCDFHRDLILLPLGLAWYRARPGRTVCGHHRFPGDTKAVIESQTRQFVQLVHGLSR